MFKRISAVLLGLALVGVSFADGLHLARLPRGFAIPGGTPPTTTVPNITALSAVFPSADPTGYDALTIGSQAAGFSWNDTVTGVKTWKLTANGTPSTGVYAPWYSQMGLAISQPYGANLDQYHIAFCNVATGAGGDGWVLDFGLSTSATPGPSNYRALPASLNECNSGGAFAFSRRAGNPDIMYVLVSGGKLRLYNVATAAFVDSSAASLGYSSSWPSTGWTWTTSVNEWMMVNAAETWISGNNAASSASAMFALNIGATGAASAVGTALTWTTGVDDTYVGYGDFVYTDQNEANIWDLDNSTTGTNAFIAVSPTFGGNANFSGDATSHMAVMRGWWVATSTINSAASPMPAGTLQPITGTNNAIGTTTTLPRNPKYLGSYHTSGNWWLQPNGTGQYYLQSNFHQTSDPGSQPASEAYAASFVNVWNDTLFRLGFLYSDDENAFLSGSPLATKVGGTGSCPSNIACYWSQPHMHISHDGKVAIFGSNMRGAAQTSFTRIDLFLMEVPLTTGTPPSFP